MRVGFTFLYFGLFHASHVIEQHVKCLLQSFKIDVCLIGQEIKTIDFYMKVVIIKKAIAINYNFKKLNF
jgi:hypothetical protein